MPLTALAWPLMSTLLPALSRAHPEPARWKRIYLSFVAPLACLTAPLAGLLFVLSEPLVLSLYGPDWEPTVPIFRALAISILVQPIYSSAGALFDSGGRSAEKLRAGILATMWYLCLYVVALPHGAIGVAGAYSCGVLLLLPAWLWWATRGTSLSVPLIFGAIWPPIAATLAGVAGCFAMGIHFPTTPAQAVVSGASLLVLYLGIALVIYVLTPTWREHLRPAVQFVIEALANAFGKGRIA
jgi:PST family polysaccharide transporter